MVWFAVTVAIWRARLTTSLYSTRLNGAISPGRWQLAQCAHKIGAMSLLKVMGVSARTGDTNANATAVTNPNRRARPRPLTERRKAPPRRNTEDTEDLRCFPR